MTEPLSPTLPEWVSKRDGRVVPFEPDKISRALFAATESLGRPDAFTARELTDGILHFLATEAEGSVLTTAQIAELVAKVVRELGQPGIAQAFVEGARTAQANGQARQELAAAPFLPLPGMQPRPMRESTRRGRQLACRVARSVDNRCDAKEAAKLMAERRCRRS